MIINNKKIITMLITGLYLLIFSVPVSVGALSFNSSNSIQYPATVFAATAPGSSGAYFQACQSNQVANNTPVCNDVQNQTKNNKNIIIQIIKDAIDVISFIVGVAAVAIIIISGIRMVLSYGNSKTIADTRMALLGAVVGIVVVALAQSFVVFVLDRIS